VAMRGGWFVGAVVTYAQRADCGFVACPASGAVSGDVGPAPSTRDQRGSAQLGS